MGFWLFRELSERYTKATIIGIIAGAVIILAIKSLWPRIETRFFVRVDRIGMVGDYGLNEIPDSILKTLSGGLTTASSSGVTLPGLASSWEATDGGKKYLFTLRPDLMWHDGTPVTNEDVNYNIQDVHVKPIGTSKVEITLPTVYAPFLVRMSRPIFRQGLIGFGPQKVISVTKKGDKIATLTTADAFGPIQARTEYRFYRTEALANTAYKLGQIDEIRELSSIESAYKTFANTTIVEKDNTDRMVALYFNMSDGLLKEKSVRQALAYAVPDLPFERAISPLSKTSWAFSPAVHRYPYDPKQASKLLSNIKESSIAGELTITTFSQYVDVAQLIASSWKTLGFNTNVKIENSLPQSYQILLSAHDIPIDPDQYPLWHSTQNTNITHYNNPKIDKLLEDGRQMLRLEDRKKLYSDFARRFMDDIPALPLYYPTTYSIVRNK